MGIIPANTGKMEWESGGMGQGKDHPREYGENVGGGLSGGGGVWIIPANTGKIHER